MQAFNEKHFNGSRLRDILCKCIAKQEPLVVEGAFAAALKGSGIDVKTFMRQLVEHVETSADFGRPPGTPDGKP